MKLNMIKMNPYVMLHCSYDDNVMGYITSIQLLLLMTTMSKMLSIKMITGDTHHFKQMKICNEHSNGLKQSDNI